MAQCGALSVGVACVQCLRTLIGHTGGVWSSQMSGNTVISGSTDRTVKVWNADTGQCVFTLYGHTSTVRCMHLHENRYFVCMQPNVCVCLFFVSYVWPQF